MRLIEADIEATQPLSEMARKLCNGQLPPMTVGVFKVGYERRRRAEERDFQVQREGIIVDSDHS